MVRFLGREAREGWNSPKWHISVRETGALAFCVPDVVGNDTFTGHALLASAEEGSLSFLLQGAPTSPAFLWSEVALWAVDVTHLVERLPSIHEIQVPSPGPQKLGHGGWYPPEIPTLGRMKQEDQKLKVILSYVATLRLAWGT